MIRNTNTGKQLNYRILITALLFGSVVGGTYIGLLSLFAFFLSALAIVVLNDEDTLCVLMFVMPFANIFKTSPGSQSFFTFLVLLYVLWYLIKKRSVNTVFLSFFLVFIVFLTLQMLISVDLLRTIKFAANILFLYFAFGTQSDDQNKKIYLYFIMGMILSSAVSALDLIPNLDSYIKMKDLGNTAGRVNRFAGLYSDPNYYSVNNIISLCLVVLMNYKKQLSALVSLLLAGALVVFAAMTLSKSAFLMLFMVLLLLLYSKVYSRNYFLFLALMLAAVIFICLVFSGVIDVFDVVLSRLTAGGGANSLTTGRSEIWKNYMELLTQDLRHLVFGGGFGIGLVEGHAAHNTYIDFIYYLGIIGTVLFLLTIGAISATRANPARKNPLNYSVLLCLVAMYFFLSQLFFYDLPFQILLALLVYKSDFRNMQTKQT